MLSINKDILKYIFVIIIICVSYFYGLKEGEIRKNAEWILEVNRINEENNIKNSLLEEQSNNILVKYNSVLKELETTKSDIAEKLNDFNEKTKGVNCNIPVNISRLHNEIARNTINPNTIIDKSK